MKKTLKKRIVKAYRQTEPTLRTTITLPKSVWAMLDGQRKQLWAVHGVAVSRDELLTTLVKEACQ